MESLRQQPSAFDSTEPHLGSGPTRSARLLLRRWARHNTMANYHAMIRWVAPAPGARLLDVGCGDGRFSALVAGALGTTDLTGVDVQDRRGTGKGTPAQFDYWATTARWLGGIAIVEHDLDTGLPFSDRSFDVVHCNQVIEHVDDTDVLVREIWRVLRIGGVLYLGTPNLASWHDIAALCIGWQPFSMHVSDEGKFGCPVFPRHSPYEGGPNFKAHRRLFTARSLPEFLEYHGLTVLWLRGVGYYPFNALARVDVRHAISLVVKAVKL